MRFLLLLACAATGALPALGVPVDVDCPPDPIPPSRPPDDVVGSGSLFLVSPTTFGVVPRNVEVILGGSVAEIPLGFWRIELSLASGTVLPSSVVDAQVIVDQGLLPANADLRLLISPSDTHPCQGCFGSQEFAFTTNDVTDTTAPVLGDSAVVVNGFVLPSPADQQACGFVGSDLHNLDVRVSPTEPAFFSIAGRGARVAPTILLKRQLLNAPAQMSLSFGRDIAFALGEPVVVVVTARDLAGNVSLPRVMRLRMRSFRDRSDPQLVPLTCSLPAPPDILVPSRLPTHPSLRVVFPFEELPILLRPVDHDGADIPLVSTADVVEDARTGHVYQSARPIDPGRYDVVAGECPRCVCPECNTHPGIRITVEDIVDEEAPSVPSVQAVLDDPSPVLSTSDCVADDAATLFVLAAGSDDVSAPQDLIYDAVIRLADGLPRPAGAAMVPWQRAGGDVVVRIPSGPFGRLAGTAFTLTVSARDAAGKVSKTTWENVVDDVGGCSATPLGSFVVLLGLLRQRRR